MTRRDAGWLVVLLIVSTIRLYAANRMCAIQDDGRLLAGVLLIAFQPAGTARVGVAVGDGPVGVGPVGVALPAGGVTVPLVGVTAGVPEVAADVGEPGTPGVE